MNMDEAIKHAKEKATEKYNEAMLCHANPDDGELDGCIECAREHEQLAEWLIQLKKYQQLEEQGRLIKLPCKVGDTVWVVTSPFNVFDDAEYDDRNNNFQSTTCLLYIHRLHVPYPKSLLPMDSSHSYSVPCTPQ